MGRRIPQKPNSTRIIVNDGNKLFIITDGEVKMKRSYQQQLDKCVDRLVEIMTRKKEIKEKTQSIQDCISRAAIRITQSQALIERIKAK